MANKKNNLIGFDPLAWMKEDSHQSPVISRQPDEVSRRASVDGRPSTATVMASPEAEDRQPVIDDVTGTIVLGETLTIEQVVTTQGELRRHLNGGSLVLDAGGLDRIDAAGLQLLVAFVRAADSRGAPVTWRGCSPALRDAARRAGLTSFLHLS